MFKGSIAGGEYAILALASPLLLPELVVGAVVVGIIVIGGCAYKAITERTEGQLQTKLISITGQQYALIESPDPENPNAKYISLVPTKVQRVDGLNHKVEGEKQIVNGKKIEGAKSIQEGNIIILGSYDKETIIELQNLCIASNKEDLTEALIRYKNACISGTKSSKCKEVDLNIKVSNVQDVKKVQQQNKIFDTQRESVDENILVKIVNKGFDVKDFIKEAKDFKVKNFEEKIQHIGDKFKDHLENAYFEKLTSMIVSDSNYKAEIKSEIADIKEGLKKVNNGEEVILY